MSSDDLHTELKLIKDQLKVITHLLQGNGDPSKGIIVRLDRIEQQSKRWSWLLKATAGAAIVLIVKAFFKM